jgi:glycosyltransferase involved in cell wall biosynthesis
VSGPSVSAIVPTWNGERFLAEALDSILAQAWEPLELIVVDDGSTDRSAEIAENRGARVLRQENRGPGAARNAGVTASTGELLAFCDQDDAWLPGKLERQVAALSAEPAAGYVYGRMEVVLEAGAEWPGWLDPGWLDESPVGWCPGTLVVRRDVFEEVGPFDERFRVFSDGEWLVRARRAGYRGLILDDVVLRYRIHERNQSHDRARHKAEVLRALRPAR